MTGASFSYVLAAGLAIALIYGAITDMRFRRIDNWLNAGIALAAPAFWWATGLSLWPDVALQLAVALGVFAFFAAMFAFGAMGGGDVKLLTALALWLPWQPLLTMLMIMALVGGALTIFMAMIHKIRRATGKLQIPYGVAIASAGLWVLGERYFNHFV